MCVSGISAIRQKKRKIIANYGRFLDKQSIILKYGDTGMIVFYYIAQQQPYY